MIPTLTPIDLPILAIASSPPGWFAIRVSPRNLQLPDCVPRPAPRARASR